MSKIQLTQLLLSCKSKCAEAWLNTNGTFFHEEHLSRFAANLIGYHENGAPNSLPLPHFSEEITPKRSVSYAFFETVISELIANGLINNASNQGIMANALQHTPFEHILVMMGQRQTPATIKTVQGLPPTKQVMMDSCLRPFNDQISVAVRAWEKHTERSEDNFWGQVSGTPQQKQQNVKHIITNIIEQHTWWNTFFHYKHHVVFEIRVESGHGMRWSYQDQSLIGFLEPFL